MHPADIIAACTKAGASQKTLAERLQISKQAINNTIHGKSRSRRIAQHIADLIGLPVERLWPGKYDTPRQPRKPRNPSRRKPS